MLGVSRYRADGAGTRAGRTIGVVHLSQGALPGAQTSSQPAASSARTGCLMDILEQLSDGRIASLSAEPHTVEDIMILHSHPFRTCPCCSGEGYHVVVQSYGFMMVPFVFKCRSCDENGLAAYLSFN
jgi:hypothetical protein